MPKRILVGTVVSDKADKTVVVKVERKVKHPLYGKIIRRSKKYHAHDADNAFKAGETVRIEETAPISKLKTWKVVDTWKIDPCEEPTGIAMDRAANRIVLHVALVDTADGHRLWAQKYDRPLADVINLQGELASAIAFRVPSMFAAICSSASAFRSYTAARWKKCLTFPDRARTCAAGTPHFAAVMSPTTGTTRFMSQPILLPMASSFFSESFRTSTWIVPLRLSRLLTRWRPRKPVAPVTK